MFVSPSYGVGVRIDFAHDTFRWRNEANGQAHALVVIVGFSKCGVREKTFFHYLSPDGEPVASHPDVIDAYLSPAPDAFIWNRKKSLCRVPSIEIGSKPIDGGNCIFTDEERDGFLIKEPGASKCITLPRPPML